MERTIIQFEWKQLLQNRALLLLLLLLLVLGILAIHSRKSGVENQIQTSALFDYQTDSVRQAYILQLDSIERGTKLDTGNYDQSPREPLNIGPSAPEYAVFQLPVAAVLAAGQSRLYATTHRVTSFGYNPYGTSEDIHNPVLRIFGDFDLAFLIVYLLPLLVIAWHYNIISGEREAGTLKLLLSQPLSAGRWIFTKTLVRWGILTLLSVGIIWLSLLVNGAKVAFDGSVLLKITFFIALYLGFWFLLCNWSNILFKSTATNLVALAGLWVVFTILLPVTINLVANELYPAPSRAALIDEYRKLTNEIEKADPQKVLNNYYNDHPVSEPKDTANPVTKAREGNKVFALTYSKLIDQLAPLFTEYNQQVSKRQQFAEKLSFLSPAALVQYALESIAGTSQQHYQSFFNQYLQRREKVLSTLREMTLQEQDMTSQKLKQLGWFRYNPSEVATQKSSHLLFLLGYVVILGLLFHLVVKKLGATIEYQTLVN